MKKSLAFIIIILIFGCNDQISDTLTSGNSSNSTSTAVTDGIGVSLVKEDYISYYIHKTDPTGTEPVSFSTEEDCTLNSNFSVITPDYIDCLVEAEELDLYLNGITFKFEATEEKCDYVAFFPYYFYRFQPGITGMTSPKNVTKVVCAAGCEANCDADYPASNWNGSGVLTTAGTYYSTNNIDFFTESNLDITNPRLNSCDFDYGDLEPSGPNCDEGEYVTTTVTYSATSCATPTTSTPVTTACNGNVRACIDGPIREFFSDTDIEDNFVTYEVENTQGQAFEKEYSIASSFSQGYMTNVYSANYTKQCGTTDPAGLRAEGIINFNNIENHASPYNTNLSDYTTYTATNPFHVEGGTTPIYTFYCLDKAFDVKARIRIMVRDWNMAFDDTLINNRLNNSVSNYVMALPAVPTAFTTTFEQELLRNGIETNFYDAAGDVSPLNSAMDFEDFESITSPIYGFQDRRDWDDRIGGTYIFDFDTNNNNACEDDEGNGVFPGNSL